MTEQSETQEDASEFDPLRALAAEVVKRRGELGMTQVDLAKAADISLATVQAIEAGRAGVPRPRTAGGLDRALRWASGSALAVVEGQPPKPLPLDLVDDLMSFTHVTRVLRPALSDEFDETPMMLTMAKVNAEDPKALVRVIERWKAAQPRSMDEAYRLVDEELGWKPGTTEELCTTPLSPETRARRAAMDAAYTPPVVTNLLRVKDLNDAQRWPSPGGLPPRLLRRDVHARPSPDKADLPPAVLSTIVMSGLSYAVQEQLIEHAMRRRRKLDGQLVEEVRGTIEMIRKVLET